MVIETRYRDIPFEEFVACAEKPGENAVQWWEVHRGQPVEILTPPCSVINFACDGPFYKVKGEPWAVCSHIAEIGD